MLNQLNPSMTQMQPLFPQDRPDVSNPTPERTPLSPEVIVKMPVNQLVDMEIADMVMDRFEASRNWRMPKRLIWDKCWQHYKGVYDKTGKARWQSATFQPATSKVVEVIASNIHGAVLGPEVPIEYQTRRPDFDQLVRSHNEIIQTDMDRCKAKAHLTDFIRTLCIMGTAIGMVDYVKEEETVMIKQRATPSPADDMLRSMGVNPQQETFVPTKMVVKDFARIINVDPYDIYPKPREAEITKDTWIIQKGKITNRELVIGSRDPDPYYRMDNVGDSLLSGSGLQRVDQDPEKQTRRMALVDYNYYSHFLDPDREHELFTYYGQIPLWYLKPDLRNDASRQYDSVPGWIQIVDGQYVIRKRISPWRDGEPPYFKGNYIRIPGEFYGVGVAELMIGLQIEKNEIRNSRMDNINLLQNKIIAVIKDMVPPGEWQRLKSEPGAVWLFKGVDDVRKAIQTVDFPDMGKDTWMASQEVDREIQETTGAVKATLGVGGDSSQSGGATFRGQMMNQQMATERFMLYARILEWMGFAEAMRKFYHRIYQFKSYQDAQEILGGTRAQLFQFIAPEDMDKVAKLVPLGVMTMENKGVKLAQLTAYHQEWASSPFLKQLELARREWTEMGFPEPDAVLFSDEEMKQFNQARQRMMAQQPGGMAPKMTESINFKDLPPQGQAQLAQQMGISLPGAPAAPHGLVGPHGQPLPQTGQAGNAPSGQPVAGNVPGPRHGMPRPAMPVRGPGASPMDLIGRPAA